jgi:hypothetical protein
MERKIKTLEIDSDILNLVANSLFEYYKELEESIGYAQSSVTETTTQIDKLKKDLVETKQDLKDMEEEAKKLFEALQILGWRFLGGS